MGALTAFMPGALSLLRVQANPEGMALMSHIQASHSLQREEHSMMSVVSNGRKPSYEHPDQAESVGVLLMFHILASDSVTKGVRSLPSCMFPLQAELLRLTGLPSTVDLTTQVPLLSAWGKEHQKAGCCTLGMYFAYQ